jgi:SAM-dependent methyltransferase
VIDADRSAVLLKGVSKSDKIIEIGPSYRPLAPKREGWNSYSLDHATREELVRKYAEMVDSHRKDHEAIEHVDFVWRGGNIADAVPSNEHGSFDILLASHVIEHTPDLVRFLQSAEKMIKRNGRIILAVPDKRFCYDFMRPLTGTADVIAGYREKRTRHTWQSYFNHSAYTYYRDGQPGWSRHDKVAFDMHRPIEQALAFADDAVKETDYVDVHAWTFTPHSLSLIIVELRALGLVNLEVERFVESDDLEFFAWLRIPDGKEPEFWQFNLERHRLLMGIMLDLEVQARMVPGNAHQEAMRIPEAK